MLLLLLPPELLTTSRVEVYREGQRFEPAASREDAFGGGGHCGLQSGFALRRGSGVQMRLAAALWRERPLIRRVPEEAAPHCSSWTSVLTMALGPPRGNLYVLPSLLLRRLP